MNKISITLAGSTGLIGSLLLEKAVLDQRVTKVKALTRREVSTQSDKVECLKIDFSSLEQQSTLLKSDVFICCLGTTIKTAGSREAFRKVDYDYVMTFAKSAAQNQAKKLIVVTALGASPNSSVFYNQVKGEVEQDLQKLNLFALDIFEPSLLLGERPEQRTGERWAQKLSPLISPFLQGPLKKYRPITAKDVAQALLNRAHTTSRGTRIFKSDEIQKLATEK